MKSFNFFMKSDPAALPQFSVDDCLQFEYKEHLFLKRSNSDEPLNRTYCYY